MGQPAVRVGVVDIGTNSMRMLITDGKGDERRFVEITGLGVGVDASGRLGDDAMERSVSALTRYGEILDRQEVSLRLAIATSASRDAANRDQFFARAEEALGTRPTLISGEQEARYAYDGATLGLEDSEGVVVSDIGGGSTELVTAGAEVSIDIGSVRLTDRVLVDRPPGEEQLEEAVEHVRSLLAAADLDGTSHVGVAGTWTTLADMSAGGEAPPHGHVLTRDDLAMAVERLSSFTVEETASVPGVHPARASVVLAGAVIARAITEHLGVDETLISERDTLDGAAMTLLALR